MNPSPSRDRHRRLRHRSRPRRRRRLRVAQMAFAVAVVLTFLGLMFYLFATGSGLESGARRTGQLALPGALSMRRIG